jgi:glyoxylate carboligase
MRSVCPLVDHVQVAEGLGRKAIRVFGPDGIRLPFTRRH